MALEAFSRLGAAVRKAATQAIAIMQPVPRQAAAQGRERQRQEVEQRQTQRNVARLSRGPRLGM